ncbi:replication initiator protein [Capybara microvirus Cap3_SP_539]|nr:replication initiator protein [Capybara microvirus Cap3_SP_539]
MDCTFPLTIKNPRTNQFIKVPCGMCIHCRIAKVRDWSLRLIHENSLWQDSCFITLTYSDDNLPLTNCGKMTLFKPDFQNFMKRLRFRVSSPIKYYACGEYGDNGNRPHYHAIIFGMSCKDLRDFMICWDKGFVTVKPVNAQRCRYVCGYIQKKIRKNPKEYQSAYGCLQPPFQLMSRGLGLGYLEKNREEYWLTCRNTLNGVPLSIPRYYLKKDWFLHTKVGLKSDSNPTTEVESYDSAIQRDKNVRAKNNLKKRKL